MEPKRDVGRDIFADAGVVRDQTVNMAILDVVTDGAPIRSLQSIVDEKETRHVRSGLVSSRLVTSWNKLGPVDHRSKEDEGDGKGNDDDSDNDSERRSLENRRK